MAFRGLLRFRHAEMFLGDFAPGDHRIARPKVLQPFLYAVTQRPTSVMRRPQWKISTLAKWLIPPLACVIIKICKKHLVFKTNSNIDIAIET